MNRDFAATTARTVKRLVTYALCAFLVVEQAVAANVTVSTVPLATSAGATILPNLMFVLDASGSMAWDFMPDYVGFGTSYDYQTSYPCLPNSAGSTTCDVGDPPYSAGGSHGFNGVAYDPNFTYKSGVTSTGANYLTAPLSTTALTPDAYLGGTNVNLTTKIQDKVYCNGTASTALCKRNGTNGGTLASSGGTALASGTDALGRTMAAGRFSYASNPSNSSTVIFGLPETMTAATFTRSSSTVTVTGETAHGLAVGDFVYITGTSTLDATKATVVSVPSTTSFTYTLASGTSPKTGFFRKHSTGSFTRSSSTVTVAATAHGMVTGDIITAVTGNSAFDLASVAITVTDADHFTYTSGTSGTVSATAGTWVRNVLYNRENNSNGTAYSYWITPVEYCADVNLTNCVFVTPGSAVPGGYTNPAYVRFCQTQAQSTSPTLISDSAGVARCRNKYINSAGVTAYTYPRYGWFNRDIITSSITSYSNRASRSDCVTVSVTPNCTYTEEIQNFARWYTFYRTRMQMMKSAVGRAMLPFISNPSATPAISDRLRIGFITINPMSGTSIDTDQYLRIDTFNTTQAASWYGKFYDMNPANGTPLQEALTRAGWIFSGKLNTGLTKGIPKTDDPMQASCQRNYTILTTDGFWNGDSSGNTTAETVNGSDIGNRDNATLTVAPYSQAMVDRSPTGTLDGINQQSVTTTPGTTITEQVVCIGHNTSTFSSNGSSSQGTCNCPATQHEILQRTVINGTVVTQVNGVTTGTNSTPQVTFTEATACSAVQSYNADTTITEIDEQVVTGTGNTSFATVNGVTSGRNTAGTCSATEHRIIRRTTTWTSRTVYTDGVPGSASIVSGSTAYAFTQVGACVGAVQFTQTVKEDEVCVKGANGDKNNPAFADATTSSCSACTSGRKLMIRETKTRTVTQETSGGVVTNTINGAFGAPGYTFSANGSTFSGSAPSGSSCAATGTTLVTSLSPNPNTGNGSSSATTTPGTTLTAAAQSFPTPPAPVNSTPTGSLLTITLSPNPTTTPPGAASTVYTAGGTADTLADVAMYYYMTDLRGGIDQDGNATGPSTNLGGTGTVDVGTNNVPSKSGAKDFATHQHMVTYTVGLADGLMRYQSDYETSSGGDFTAIKNGTLNGCFWTAGTCNWPTPVPAQPETIDDLWHAAVNGRGVYYQALNADALNQGIQSALTNLNAQVASASASATSSPNVTQTDNQIFSTTYETSTWAGKVFSQTIDPSTGNVNSTIQWEADTLLLSLVSSNADSRNLYTFSAAGTNKLKTFTWANLTATQQGYFTNKCSPVTNMAQCSSLSSGQLATANDGASLLSWVRGQQQYDGTPFRDRSYFDPTTNASIPTVLGDTITARPVYVRNPTVSYTDTAERNGATNTVVTLTAAQQYAAFSAANTSRAARVFVSANDGFIHAFDGNTGTESWAYTPSFIMSGLWQLADSGYAISHKYFVDGSPETGDVYDTGTSQWKTILVSGVGAGGNGFYALDITDPTTPKGLWEFCNDSTKCASYDADLGLAMGNAVIGKRAYDGRWVVVLTSGLNNSGGTGIGYFYVLDAVTGALLNKVSTGAGSSTTPAGLLKISAFYNTALTDATFQYVYGGDQLGNVWRLDLGAATPAVLHLATLKDNSATPRAQPITTRPALTHIGTDRILYIGTGRYLGSPDLSDQGAGAAAWQQSLYAFKDKGTDYGATGLRTDTNMLALQLTSVSATERGIAPTVTGTAMDWTVKDGWYLDFNPVFSGGSTLGDSPGEGVNLVDPRLVLGTLDVTTNAPSAGSNSCSVGGNSFNYNIDFKTGLALTNAGGVAGKSLGGTITVGVAIVQLPSGAIKSINTGADTSKTTTDVVTSATGATVKRFSYREL